MIIQKCDQINYNKITFHKSIKTPTKVELNIFKSCLHQSVSDNILFRRYRSHLH